MKPIREVRRERLAHLVTQMGGQSAVAARLGKDKNQIYQWLQPEESKASRNISDGTARLIEAAYSLPKGWMDQPLSEQSAAAVSPEDPAGLAAQASQSEQLDDEKLERSIQFLERQFALYEREFVASRHIDLITGVYARIGRRGESNLIALSQWLTQKLEQEEPSDVGTRGIRGAVSGDR